MQFFDMSENTGFENVPLIEEQVCEKSGNYN